MGKTFTADQLGKMLIYLLDRDHLTSAEQRHASAQAELDKAERTLKSIEQVVNGSEAFAEKLIAPEDWEDAKRAVEYQLGKRDYRLRITSIEPYEGPHHSTPRDYYHVTIPYGHPFDPRYAMPGATLDPDRHDMVRVWLTNGRQDTPTKMLKKVLAGEQIGLVFTFWDGPDGKGEEDELYTLAVFEAIDAYPVGRNRAINPAPQSIEAQVIVAQEAK